MENSYSGKQVSKTGKYFLDFPKIMEDQEKFNQAMDVLSYWRFSHEVPLDFAFQILQTVCLKVDRNAIFAKRLKRYISIIQKLNRFDSMKLKNMQDIGGCRAILTSKKRLNKAVRALKKIPEFKHNKLYKTKNYIKNPKDDGYRSFHIIGKFPDVYGSHKKIEIQLRTSLQHYWATALEIVDIFTNQALKSNQGAPIWKSFFKNVSAQFAIMDDIHLFNTLSYNHKLIAYTKTVGSDENIHRLCKITLDHCDQLDIFKTFQAFSNSLRIIDEKLVKQKDAEFVLIEVDTSKNSVHSIFFSKEENKLAQEKYIEAEKKAAKSTGVLVVLVSTTAVGGIKEAYPNYFADSSEFIKHLTFVAQAAGSNVTYLNK